MQIAVLFNSIVLINIIPVDNTYKKGLKPLKRKKKPRKVRPRSSPDAFEPGLGHAATATDQTADRIECSETESAMKRKKWSEAEEKTLLTKYADLVNAGTLAKLKTREKKFKPVAEHVNQLHHLRDSNAFPFKWTWRDVSIKVQNMRHQYLGVKQKIRVSDLEFDWDDGDNHWDNFSRYKEVFGDVDLMVNGANDTTSSSSSGGEDSCGLDRGLGLGFEVIYDEESHCRIRRKLGQLGGKVLELRGVIGEMEEKRRRREFDAEEAEIDLRRERLQMDEMRERWEEESEVREMEFERREIEWEMRMLERRMRMDEEEERERERRMEREEKRVEEEMEWREKMLRLQIEHEKSMMRIYTDAWQNQMQIVGGFGRLLCQLFGSVNEGLGATPPPPQSLQNLPGDMDDDDNVKPGTDPHSQFL